MRRSFTGCAAALAAALVASAAPAPAFHTVDREGAWRLISVSPTARSVPLQLYAGGCLHATAVPTVTETATAIDIHLRQREDVIDQPREGCTAELRPASLVVVLPSPLAGRALVGSPPWPGSDIPLPADVLPMKPGDDVIRMRAPRVAGLAPQDAVLRLHRGGWPVRILHRRGPRLGLDRVVRQKPAAGAVVPRGTFMTLVVDSHSPQP
jgi:hypothetical protein